MTVLDSLRSISGYPLSASAVETAAVSRGLDSSAELTREIVESDAYRLAKADVMMMLADAPDVTQEGISYSFTDGQRNSFRMSASVIYGECGDDTARSTLYGYKGDRL